MQAADVGAWGCLASVALIVALTVLGWLLNPEAERERFHCLSAWDGNHDGLERLVRARLNDPDSLDTIRTHIGPVSDAGKRPVRMEFTAANAFGGRLRNNAIGLIDNDTCEATLLSIN